MPRRRQLDAGDERRGHGAEADGEDAELAVWRGDVVSLGVDEVFRFQDDSSLACERDERLMPLRGYAACVRPVLHGGLSPAEKGAERALTPEADDDAFGGVRSPRGHREA